MPQKPLIIHDNHTIRIYTQNVISKNNELLHKSQIKIDNTIQNLRYLYPLTKSFFIMIITDIGKSFEIPLSMKLTSKSHLTCIDIENHQSLPLTAHRNTFKVDSKLQRTLF